MKKISSLVKASSNNMKNTHLKQVLTLHVCHQILVTDIIGYIIIGPFHDYRVRNDFS